MAGIIIRLAASSHIDLKAAKKAKIRDCWSVDGFVRAEDVRHGMSDEELFWRASMVPMKEDYPYDRVPKVAFMFMTRGPLPMLPLWEKFFRGNEKYLSVYVHTPHESWIRHECLE
ncbi:unnamed protein product [Brassica oleracea var. botrytis]|uniref:Uncharacterized protein n=2 Tax=Brassica oleracea TaxID=3712 RepID=A0A0D3AQM1_BRAOL|nr:unnamed protein product [Brassica oleracea]